MIMDVYVLKKLPNLTSTFSTLLLVLTMVPAHTFQNIHNDKCSKHFNIANIQLFFRFFFFETDIVLQRCTGWRAGKQECVMQFHTFQIESDVSIHELITFLNGFISMVFICMCLHLSPVFFSSESRWDVVKENCIYFAGSVHLTPLSKVPIGFVSISLCVQYAGWNCFNK